MFPVTRVVRCNLKERLCLTAGYSSSALQPMLNEIFLFNDQLDSGI